MSPPTTDRPRTPEAALAAGLLAATVWLVTPATARAGMPMATLSDVGRARFQVISFFLLVLLLCAWAVQRIWNGLAADVPGLPKLSFRKAGGVITLWGLLFVLVLTMISGARELMTPGAWKKQGFTYKLVDDPPKAEPPATTPAPAVDQDAARREAIGRLRLALRVYARSHDGRFPPGDGAPEIDPETWLLPGQTGLRYLYCPGRKLDQADAVIAYEPGLYGGPRYALYADGAVRLVALDALRAALGPPSPAAPTTEAPR